MSDQQELLDTLEYLISEVEGKYEGGVKHIQQRQRLDEAKRLLAKYLSKHGTAGGSDEAF